jgi:hypothetical protein
MIFVTLGTFAFLIVLVVVEFSRYDEPKRMHASGEGTPSHGEPQFSHLTRHGESRRETGP